MSKKIIIINQIVMTCLMAFSMSGIMLLIAMGPIPGFIGIWIPNFLIAWPIAFVATNLAWPIAAFITRKIAGSSLAH